eukprot:EG_transcript_24392
MGAERQLDWGWGRQTPPSAEAGLPPGCLLAAQEGGSEARGGIQPVVEAVAGRAHEVQGGEEGGGLGQAPQQGCDWLPFDDPPHLKAAMVGVNRTHGAKRPEMFSSCQR